MYFCHLMFKFLFNGGEIINRKKFVQTYKMKLLLLEQRPNNTNFNSV